MTVPAVSVPVAVQILPHGEGLDLPAYATEHAAAVDLCAAVGQDAPITLQAGERKLIPTGLALALPEGFEAQIRPRSGLALKNGLSVLNSPGTIDADYRGEVQVILANLGNEPFTITRGMRIAQMVLAPYTRLSWSPTASLPPTARGTGGFGSTGVG